MYKIAGEHSPNYPPSFLFRYLERVIRSLFLFTFQLPNSDIRRTIIDTLYDVFCLRRPKETDDFMVALESVDPSSMQVWFVLMLAEREVIIMNIS